MKKFDKLVAFLSIIGVLASIGTLGFFSFVEFFNSESSKSFLVGALGSVIGAVIATFILRLKSRAKAPSVFISYHHENKEIAQKIAKEMKVVSGHVWLDEQEINIGDSIKEKLESGLKNSDYFLIILSEKANKSNWAKAELTKAMELGKVVFPVITDDAEVPEVIKNIAYADLRGSFDTGIDKLKRAFIETSHNK